MSTLTIRNLDEDLKASLRVRTAIHGQSMEEEVRTILRNALRQPEDGRGLGQRLVERFRPVAEELTLPPRSLPRETPFRDDLT